MRVCSAWTVLLTLVVAGCADPRPPLDPPVRAVPRHPLTTSKPAETVIFRGQRPAVRDANKPGGNERLSRQPTMAPRIEANPLPPLPTPEHPGNSLQRDLQRILDAKPPPDPRPVGTIDTRPGTIRTTPGTIDRR